MTLQPRVDTTYFPANWSTDRNGVPVVAILAHSTGGWDSRAYLKRGGDLPDGSDRKVSIHTLIRKDGRIYRYLDDERGANHAGFGTMPAPWTHLNPNTCTIGFELENASNGKGRVDPYTEVQLLSMGWEINRIRAKYGNLPILRHGDIDPTRRSDPVGLSVAQMEDWARRAAVHFGGDPFAEWGNIGTPTGDVRGWLVPQTWLKNKAALGRCLKAEEYPLPGTGFSYAIFTGGVICYVASKNAATVVLF